MKNNETVCEDTARAARVLKRIAEFTVDEWEAKIAYYAAENAKLELIEQNMMTEEPELRARPIRQRKIAKPAANGPEKQSSRKIKVAK